MRIDYANKVLIFGSRPVNSYLHSLDQPRGITLEQRVKKYARNHREKPLGRKVHAVIRGEGIVAVRLYETDILTFTQNTIVINYGSYKTQLTLSVMNEFLTIYGLTAHQASKGPYKGDWFLSYRSRRYLTGEDSIIIPPRGLRVDYRGRDIDNVGPNWNSQEFGEYKRRSNRAARLQYVAHSLGFGSTFMMDGYKLPKDKSDESIQALNDIARQLGYANVERAWYAGGIMINDMISEEEMEMLMNGGAKLLRSAREDQNAGNRY